MIYHEKQKGDLCRLHAINNILGFKYLDEAEFSILCDKFDKMTKMDKLSRIVFYNSGGLFNIFGYCIFRKFNIRMKHHEMGKKKDISISNDKNMETLGYFIYNLYHVWVVRKIDNSLYLVDSLFNNVYNVDISYVNGNEQNGVIEVFTVGNVSG